MASAALGEELSCSICLNLCMEPTTLRCGHNFCQDCFVIALDTQEGSGVCPCPGCREEYAECPVPEKKSKQSNTMEDSRSVEQEKSGVLTEPTSSFRNKKCSIHKKLLEYYCSEDALCLCVSCCLVGEHKEHKVELLEEASEKKKEKLRIVCEKETTARGAIEGRIQNLQDHKRKAQENADHYKKRVTALYETIRRQLEVQERRVLSEISRQEEKVSLSVSELIHQLETQKETLSRKICHIEEMCNINDPITFLQEPEIEDQDMEEPEVCDVDHFLILLTLHRSLTDLMANIKAKNRFHVTKLLLDRKTANDYLALSLDLKSASVSDIEQIRPKFLKRFTHLPQVMSIESFSIGRYYWEVEVSGTVDWDIAVCYPTIDRGYNGYVGNSDKAWSLNMTDIEPLAEPELEPEYESLHHKPPVQKVGVCLDYDNGSVSFYQLSNSIKQLQTYTATFTEPLHAAFYLSKGCLKLSS